jgi:hypothetical protein
MKGPVQDIEGLAVLNNEFAYALHGKALSSREEIGAEVQQATNSFAWLKWPPFGRTSKRLRTERT